MDTQYAKTETHVSVKLVRNLAPEVGHCVRATALTLLLAMLDKNKQACF